MTGPGVQRWIGPGMVGGARRWVGIAMDGQDVARGWEAFGFVESALHRHGLTAEQVDWRWCNEFPTGIYRVVFEVVDAPPRWLTADEVVWRRGE